MLEEIDDEGGTIGLNVEILDSGESEVLEMDTTKKKKKNKKKKKKRRRRIIDGFFRTVWKKKIVDDLVQTVQKFTFPYGFN